MPRSLYPQPRPSTHCIGGWTTSQKVAGSIHMGSLGFFIDITLSAVLWPGVNSASNRNEYQKYFLGGKDSQYIGLTTLPPSYASCHEIWEFQPPGNFRACTGTLLYLLYITICDFRQLTICCLHWTFLLQCRNQFSSFSTLLDCCIWMVHMLPVGYITAPW
jgi:hypothetical protein